MRSCYFWAAPVCAVLIGCGSPQDYSKTQLSDDSTATSFNIGIGIKKEHAIWANTLVRSVYESRRLWESGDAEGAVRLTDALLMVGRELFDSLPRSDDRSRFLSVLLVDLHQQGITWQRMRGDTMDVRARTEEFRDFKIAPRRHRFARIGPRTIMLGTWINVATVVAGSLVGMAVGDRLPERIRKIVFIGLALMTLGIGVSMVIRGSRPLVIIMSIVLGAAIGELIDIERRLEQFAGWFQARVRIGGADFVRGFVTASLLFCVGPMTVVGSIQDGLSGDSTILVTKAIMDGFASIALAATAGVGVLFAAVTVLIVQGGLTILGRSLAVLAQPEALNQLTGVGGLLIIGLALRMLEIKEIRVGNLLPALVIVALLVVLV